MAVGGAPVTPINPTGAYVGPGAAGGAGSPTYAELAALLPSRPTALPANGATYRSVGVGYAAYATPTDMMELVGSATKTVAVTRVILFPNCTTTARGDFYFIKRTAANTGGTKAAQTITKLDSGSAAATAVFNHYSVIPSGLGAGGTVDIFPMSIVGPTTSLPSRNGLTAALGGGPSYSALDLSTPVILRGVAESLVVNFNGAAIPAGFTTGWMVEWVEF